VPPDVAVEVVSPNDLQRDVLTRVGEYLDAGVARVWVVYAEPRAVVLYGRGREQSVLVEGDTLGPDELGIDGADVSLAVNDIFR
jgi:Uma2 family endonuclease